jgi:hypothetical protein
MDNTSIVERVKNILLSSKSEWVVIDQGNASLSKTLTSYLLLLAAIPAVISLFGYLFYGIYEHLPFKAVFKMGFKVTIMMYVVVVGGAFITAFVTNLVAENFGSVRNFDKAFALSAYAWTPFCVAGVLLIYPVPFLFWLWIIIGICYGIFLLYDGIRILLKTPFEQLTPHIAICAGGFVAAFFLLTIILSYMFFDDIYFRILPRLPYLESFRHFYRY